jgi:hypothetical protein
MDRTDRFEFLLRLASKKMARSLVTLVCFLNTDRVRAGHAKFEQGDQIRRQQF